MTEGAARVTNDPLVMGSTVETACQEGDVEEIVRQLDGGKSVDCADGYGNTPIMLALAHPHHHPLKSELRPIRSIVSADFP